MATILTQVKLATSYNFDLADALTVGVSTIDGKLIYANDRILVKSQTDRKENGIYIINSSGYFTRATDFAVGASITPTTVIFVQQGEQFADTGWVVSTDSATNSLTVGTTEIEFTRFSLNLNILGADLPSSIVLRSEKGYPLTITELDNNFKYLAVSLTQKLNIADFTQTAICDRINSVTYEVSNIDANKLHGIMPTSEVVQDTQTIPVRTTAGNITSTTFTGDLVGNADTADFATMAQTAHNLDQINPVLYGGTGASTAAGARANLNVVNRAGDSMTGKLTLAAATSSYATLNIPAQEATIGAPADGDIWSSATSIFYRKSGVNYTVAQIESPAFTGTPTAPNPTKASNSGAIATTNFVQQHVSDLNAAINLRATIDSPTLTGNPKSVTPPTDDNDTSIATTAFVVNKLNTITPYYYTKDQADAFHATEEAARIAGDSALNARVDDLAKMRGIPVGMINYYAAANVPVGWLKCDGSMISKVAYPQLFDKIGYTYGGSGNDFRLPQLMGEFIRGWDGGRGVDANRQFGSWQKGTFVVNRWGIDNDNDRDTIGNGNQGTADQYGSDTISSSILGTNYAGCGVRLGNDDGAWSAITNTTQLLEWVGITRPRNVAMLPCIKAYGDIDDPDLILATNVLESINYKVDRRGDTMTGVLSLSQDPTSAMHAATKSYVDNKVAAVSLTPGPQGPAGPAGIPGPQGPAGVPYTITYGNTQYSTTGYTNSVGNWYNHANYFDVYPPNGKTMANLLAFLPSIAVIHYAGGVDGNDSMRCTWSNLGDRIRVYVQNTEQRSTPAANWIAFWS